jgi:hypothetical protein
VNNELSKVAIISLQDSKASCWKIVPVKTVKVKLSSQPVLQRQSSMEKRLSHDLW